ncbi:MAG: hypothetical protein FWE53_02755 [Firmicutes bacterium]|nr:hypothetical protein [Bacillota bacterium]
MKTSFIAIISEQHQPDYYGRVLPVLEDMCALCGLETENLTVFNESTCDINLISKQLTEPCIMVFDSGTFGLADEFLKNISSKLGRTVTQNACGASCGNVLLIDLNSKNLYKNLNLKLFESVFTYDKVRSVLKIFGISRAQLTDSLLTLIGTSPISFNISSHCLESSVVLHAPAAAQKSYADEVERAMYQQFGESIFADSYESLYHVVEDLLSFRKVKLSIADSLTGGIMLNELKTGFNKFDSTVAVFKSIARKPDFFSMLKITETQAEAMEGSIELAYEIAASLLQESPSTLAIVLCGTYSKPFVAVGDGSGIHVYKFNLTAGERFVAELLTKNAMHKIIKKLRQNDLCFYDNNV